MAEADQLTLGINTEAKAEAPTPQSGLLVTNHLNLMYMLATGLVMPPAGFGEKYYRDTLECFPGWIPLFVDKAPAAAIESSTQEAGHLKPVIVQIGLTELSGKVATIGRGGIRELTFPGGVDVTEYVLLVPAPLPASWIEWVFFQSAHDKRACERSAKDLGNVPLEDFRSDAKRKALFAKAPNTEWPPRDGPEERTVPLERPLAAGGVMAMLFLFGNLGDQAVRACRSAFDPAGGPLVPADHGAILAGLEPWMREGAVPLPASTDAETDRTSLQNAYQGALFWGAVERLAKWREAGRANSPESVLIDYLAEPSATLDPRARAGVRKLQDTLESLTGIGDATASELFERHNTPLAHAMTLLFLCRDCVDLFDYRSDRLGEMDWLAAAILFGVRDGWLNLPLRLRGPRDLSAAVSHRMAQMAHRLAGTELDLGDAPAMPIPLRKLFGDGADWRARDRAAALELARLYKWDCVRTRINLGPGEYKLAVKSGSTYIELPGTPKIDLEIERDQFLSLLANARLDRETEAKVRRMLRG